MIDAHIIKLKGQAVFYVVASKEALSNIRAYADIQDENHVLDTYGMMNRIDFHNAYCFIRPLSLLDRMLVFLYRKKLQKESRWISIDLFTEAYCVAYPDDAIRALPFSREEIISVIRETGWQQVFDFDSEEIIQRLLKENPDPKDLADSPTSL